MKKQETVHSIRLLPFNAEMEGNFLGRPLVEVCKKTDIALLLLLVLGG